MANLSTNNPASPGRSSKSDFDEAKDVLKTCYSRLEILERKLQFQPMSEEDREQAEKDIMSLKKILQEDSIKLLGKENQGSTLIAVLLIFASFFIYGIYHMFRSEAEVSSTPSPI